MINAFMRILSGKYFPTLGEEVLLLQNYLLTVEHEQVEAVELKPF